MEWLGILLLLGILSNAAAEYYTIIAPKAIRPDSEYHITANFIGSGPATVYLELIGEPSDTGNIFNISEQLIVYPYTTKIIRLNIGEAKPGQYKLNVRAHSELSEFSKSIEIVHLHKSYSVFIQTDRAIYKPGHKILFRCVILDSRLRPSIVKPLDVYIVDGDGNRIKIWNRPAVTHGVFNGELELSQSPVLGTWNIIVDIDDQKFEKEFEVATYVLPNFEVTIDTPRHVSFKDSQIVATVHAKYTYGKPVKGEATITAYPGYFSGVIQPIYQQPVRKVLPIDGKVTAYFDIVSELRLADQDYERPIKIDVVVEEGLTTRRQNASAQITLHKHKYTIDLIQSSEHYKPGLKFTAFIKITYHDGSPVQDTKNEVLIAYGYSNNHSRYLNMSRKLDKHGMIQLDFYPPKATDNTSRYLSIEVQYLNFHEWFPSISQAASSNNEYIQAVLLTQNPRVNSYIEIEVNSTSPLKYISYEVLGRGDILDASTFHAEEEYSTYFQFLATYVMAPTVHIIVYYIKDGEVIADSLFVELSGMLQNYVDIETRPREVKPGENVNLMISTKPNSFIGLLGVDQRSILLKSGNDISYDKVYKELLTYDFVHMSPYTKSYSNRNLVWSPGRTTDDVFRKSGTVILTNGYVYEYFPPLYYRANLMDEAMYASVTELSSPDELSKKVKVRKNFPETWLWQMLDAGSQGNVQLRQKVPDSITSWVLTAFSVNDAHGLGVIEEPRKLKVFRPFFISMDLPYSVIRGEVVGIQVAVFNYMNKDVTAEVLLTNDGYYEFAETANEVQSNRPTLELYRKKKVDVKANSGSSVTFMIIPRELGYISIRAAANNVLAGDRVEQMLLVKAEGETQYKNEAILLDLRKVDRADADVIINIPNNAVLNSESVQISAIGDIMGSIIPNLANLIKMPFGCGEQNMLNFVPNIVILNYLKNTLKLTQAVQTKAVKYLNIGYQQELTYKHADGSFSAFGTSDPSGSTWLTAFVAKSFKQAADYIKIDEAVLNKALEWLIKIQAPNGSFPEVGKVSHRDMQGGAAKGLALTAYTLIAFIENADYIPRFRNELNKAVDYLVRNIEGVDDVYTLSLCAYALNRAGHPYDESVFNVLESKAITKQDLKWWSKPVSKDDKNPHYSLPRSVDVEMTSYALLTYLERRLFRDSIPIMRWLIKQRNIEGGFASTQDTVIGLQALAKLAEKLSRDRGSAHLTFIYKEAQSPNTVNSERDIMDINSDNAMILHKHILPPKTRSVHITAVGTGLVLVQVSYQYNLNVTGAWPLFTLDPQVDKNSNKNHLQLSICSGFVPTKEANESNMAVMEVNLPSGFTVDKDSLASLELSSYVQRVETKNSDTMVVLYFDKMVKQEYCPTVSAFMTHKVAKQKPVPVSIYDYYDSSRRARVFYEPKKTALCDLCEDKDCEHKCVSKPDKQKVNAKVSAASHVYTCHVYTCVYLQFIFLVLFFAL